MPKFGKVSKRRLITCDPLLQVVANEVVKYFDCTVVCGKRSKTDQDEAFANKKSKVRWPNSKHNVADSDGNETDGLSKGIDLAPYVVGKGIVWNPRSCCYLAGIVMYIAHLKGIKLRYGGDWDQDQDLTDQQFNDLVHFEVVD